MVGLPKPATAAGVVQSALIKTENMEAVGPVSDLKIDTNKSPPGRTCQHERADNPHIELIETIEAEIDDVPEPMIYKHPSKPISARRRAGG